MRPTAALPSSALLRPWVITLVRVYLRALCEYTPRADAKAHHTASQQRRGERHQLIQRARDVQQASTHCLPLARISLASHNLCLLAACLSACLLAGAFLLSSRPLPLTSVGRYPCTSTNTQVNEPAQNEPGQRSATSPMAIFFFFFAPWSELPRTPRAIWCCGPFFILRIFPNVIPIVSWSAPSWRGH